MENHYCILGSPGTGKTTALIARIARAVSDTAHYGGDIVICSLTRTAAHEIAERVKVKMPGVEFPHVGTVHALALRALKAIGDEPKLVYDEDLIKQFNEETHRKLPLKLGNSLMDAEVSSESVRLLSDMDKRRAAQQPSLEWPRATLNFYNQWTDWKDRNGLLDFTDLIERATTVCQSHPANPKYIFVDEAQDLSRLEMRLIKQWAKGTEKTIVAGDDQQALYEWRGASVQDFIDFAHPGNRHILPRSYRMKRKVYEAANLFGERISLKIDKQFEPVSEGGEVHRKLSPYLIQDVLSDIKTYDSVMLIASCGYMLNPYIRALRALGVPYHNPYRSRSEGRTWNPLKSKYADAFRAFLMPSTGQHMWTWSQFHRVVQFLDRLHAPQEMKRQARARKNSRAAVPPEFVDEWSLNTLLEAAKKGDYEKYFELMAVKHRFGPQGRVSSMGYLSRAINSHGLQVLNEKPKLIVGTVHSVKGGEADSVFLLPHVSPEAHRSMVTQKGKDGLLRTFYVGASRAKTKLTLIRVPSERRAMWR